jgi:hypothetical protein
VNPKLAPSPLLWLYHVAHSVFFVRGSFTRYCFKFQLISCQIALDFSDIPGFFVFPDLFSNVVSKIHAFLTGFRRQISPTVFWSILCQ